MIMFQNGIALVATILLSTACDNSQSSVNTTLSDATSSAASILYIAGYKHDESGTHIILPPGSCPEGVVLRKKTSFCRECLPQLELVGNASDRCTTGGSVWLSPSDVAAVTKQPSFILLNPIAIARNK